MTSGIDSRLPRRVRVLFVACNRNRHRFLEDPSFLYRCQNMAAALRSLGHEATLTHITRLNPWADADLIVFHRPRNTMTFRAALRILQRRDVRLIADVDDLIFDERLARFSPGVRNNLVPLAGMEALFVAHRKALERFEHITVSTACLEEETQRCLPNANVVRLPNAVHHDWRDLPDTSRQPHLHRPVITYLPGTRSHDRDFATVAPVLTCLLERYPELSVQITGPLTFELRGRPGQVRHFPRVPFGELYPRVRDGWLNIAPLETTPFTRCKSALKVIEAGYFGIPTLNAPLPDAQRFFGAGALVASTPQQWYEYIERLLLEPAYHAEQTTGLRERVLARADVFAIAQQLVQVGVGEAVAA